MNGQPADPAKKVSNAGFGYIGLSDSVSRLPWKENRVAFLHLREAMEKIVKTAWKDGRLAEGTAEKLCRVFGVDRVGTLLSYNLYRKVRSPELSWRNRGWAGAYVTPAGDSMFGDACVAQIPPAALNALTDQFREHVIALELHGEEACLPGRDTECFRGKVLLIRPDQLPDPRRSGNDQYFYARSGFGCEPGKAGSRVFGVFLNDGQEACFRRADFIGVADGDQLPDWVKDARQELREEDFGEEAYAFFPEGPEDGEEPAFGF